LFFFFFFFFLLFGCGVVCCVESLPDLMAPIYMFFFGGSPMLERLDILFSLSVICHCIVNGPFFKWRTCSKRSSGEYIVLYCAIV
jgi:hypothetical protein